MEFETLLEPYSDAVKDKAADAVHRGDVFQDKRGEGIFWVNSSDGSKVHRVQLWPTYNLTCTCINGSNLGGEPRCFHSAAVLLTLEALQRARNIREVYGSQFQVDDD